MELRKNLLRVLCALLLLCLLFACAKKPEPAKTPVNTEDITPEMIEDGVRVDENGDIELPILP